MLAVLVWVFWPKPTPRAAMTGAAPGIITLKEGSSAGTGGSVGFRPFRWRSRHSTPVRFCGSSLDDPRHQHTAPS